MQGFENELLTSGFTRELIVFLIAMLPIFELRGALPVGINLFDIPWYSAFGLAVLGNILPVPFIRLLLDSAVKLLGRVGFFRRFFDWLFARTRRRGGAIERYRAAGLVLFVAVPLPFTGAWTGALAAVLFGLKASTAFLAILAGVLIAGVIVTSLSLLGWLGATLAGVALAGLVIAGAVRGARLRAKC